jgi:hypothetical protein
MRILHEAYAKFNRKLHRQRALQACSAALSFKLRPGMSQTRRTTFQLVGSREFNGFFAVDGAWHVQRFFLRVQGTLRMRDCAEKKIKH